MGKNWLELSDDDLDEILEYMESGKFESMQEANMHAIRKEQSDAKSG